MQGYKYLTETESQTARAAAAAYKGLPKEGGTTLYWVDYNYSDLDGFYYITYDEGLEAVLGTPEDLTITPHEEYGQA